tara:strand:+ start:6959 stop:7342 length:384 start_codon:yes stop_codon:yes gene_type:complete
MNKNKEEVYKLEIKDLKEELWHEKHSKDVARRSADLMHRQNKKLIEDQESVIDIQKDRDYWMAKCKSKRLQRINAFYVHDNEIGFEGKDEYGDDFSLTIDSYEFLEWIDCDHIKNIKIKLINHINNK